MTRGGIAGLISRRSGDTPSVASSHPSVVDDHDDLRGQFVADLVEFPLHGSGGRGGRYAGSDCA